MAGSYDLFDGQQLTGPSEYDSRYGTAIDTLQLHHATMTSLSGLIGMMMPGGRQVSANGAMGNDGTLIEVVPLSERAFTSATSYDRRCLTVECCNTTLDPEWGVSDETHRRAGKLAADMFRAGLLGGITRQYIIGHREVPGAYATSCPGPSFDLDLVVQYALQEFTGKRPITPKGIPMFTIIRDPATTFVYAVGADGRRTGVQNERQFSALTRLRESIFNTGQDIEEFFIGDFDDPEWGNLRSILDAINGDGEPQETTWKPSDQDLAKIGAAARIDTAKLLADIAKLDDAEHAKIVAEINKPRTATIS